MSEDDDGASPPDRSYPPPPPADAPTADESGGSIVLGLVLGLVGTALGAFGPFFVFTPEGVGLLLLWLVPIVLVVGIALTVKGSTRRTGVGTLLGWAVGLLVSAGTCLYLLSTLGVG